MSLTHIAIVWHKESIHDSTLLTVMAGLNLHRVVRRRTSTPSYFAFLGVSSMLVAGSLRPALGQSLSTLMPVLFGLLLVVTVLCHLSLAPQGVFVNRRTQAISSGADTDLTRL